MSCSSPLPGPAGADGGGRVKLVPPARWQFGEYVYRIERDDGVNVGEIAFRNLRRGTGQAELGIELFPAYRGHGYGPEAILLLLDELFGSYGLSRVYLRVRHDNERARRAYEKCGFKVTAVVRWPVIRRVRYIVMEISRTDHLSRRGRG